MFSKNTFYLFSLLLCSVLTLNAQPISLKNATIIVAPSVPSPMKETAARMLTEEIAKRTNITLKTATAWPKTNAITVALVLSGDRELLGKTIPVRDDKSGAEYRAEGFRVVSEANEKGGVVWIIGADARGVLFGTGWLLRKLQLANGVAQLDTKVDFASSPAYPIRGHQLGYRHTANSYDAWSVAQYEQYFRELAIFGANAVEGIPFHEDEKPNPHFKIPASEMRIKMGELCQLYDMDYWVWTPVTFELTDKEKRAAELKLHEEFYKNCPRLDHIFVPGGDPGDNHPSEVMPFLKDLYQILTKYHPKAKVWISLQGFSVEQVDYFYRYLAENNPDWLQGVVSGPSSPPMAETRFRLPKKYQHREYPDITHNVRCEFPVRGWDQAYALTLGREASNPRPYAFAEIHQTYAPFTDGFVSYSDGCHDDINKVIWSMRGWNPQTDVREILTDYTNFFFGKTVTESAADGIAALENNWKGPLVQNGGVEATFAFWKNLETTNPALKGNWRWQMLLLRAYYDTYTKRRLTYEQSLEKQANALLLEAPKVGVEKAMQAALETVNKADKVNIAPELRQKIEQLCADLFASIGLQTSVQKHQAKSHERGAVLDLVDYPLNNRWWLADEFKKINALPSNEAKLQRLKTISTWENPGPGSFYDDVSSVAKGPRVKTFSDDATDVAWWQDGFSRTRLSSQLFQKCPELVYDNLQPGARYIIRVVGEGEALLRVDNHRLQPTVYNRETESVKEWIVPLSLTQDGKLHVTFDEPEESHLNWRKQSKISDVWLLKQ
ncbi:hypothetical protein [Runella aurantiaca]|uniref:Alpha glucuronidase N-terminal domain-containing protein n=1 Tax=Runella aurantiaca TaxID=2282308 RepID=A0A369IH14_9BACT|nr:hypothetical protein [Runella aurantiaca]RDB07485.1 hypothetical protein DVG78_05185 [Runella aurantiaca]